MPFTMLKEVLMNWLNKKNLRKWLRLLHRDLGFFVVGLTLVYGISGFILNHKKTSEDPAFKTISFEEQLPPLLTVSELTTAFQKEFATYTLNKVLPTTQRYQLFLQGGVGSYVPETGQLTFEIYQKKPLIYFFNKLHYNQKNHWTAPADFFAFGMIFLALSGIFMVRGKKGLTGSGKWYLLAGFVLLILYVWL